MYYLCRPVLNFVSFKVHFCYTSQHINIIRWPLTVTVKLILAFINNLSKPCPVLKHNVLVLCIMRCIGTNKPNKK